MSTDFLPTRDADLVAFAANMKAVITPTPGQWGLNQTQTQHFGVLADAFAAAYQTAVSPQTRSPYNITQKDLCRASLVENLRQLVGIVQKFPGTTDAMRRQLGVTVPSGSRTPVPPPSVAPNIDVLGMAGRTLSIRLHDGTGTGPTRSKAKPAGCTGASIFTATGDAAPNDTAGWQFHTSTSKTLVDIPFPPTLAPGTTVWVTAYWTNAKLQSGPPATPATAVIQFGDPGLKTAA